MNTGGSGSFSNYYKAVVGFIGGVTITGLGLIFRIKGFKNGV